MFKPKRKSIRVASPKAFTQKLKEEKPKIFRNNSDNEDDEIIIPQ